MIDTRHNRGDLCVVTSLQGLNSSSGKVPPFTPSQNPSMYVCHTRSPLFGPIAVFLSHYRFISSAVFPHFPQRLVPSHSLQIYKCHIHLVYFTVFSATCLGTNTWSVYTISTCLQATLFFTDYPLYIIYQNFSLHLPHDTANHYFCSFYALLLSFFPIQWNYHSILPILWNCFIFECFKYTISTTVTHPVTSVLIISTVTSSRPASFHFLNALTASLTDSFRTDT